MNFSKERTLRGRGVGHHGKTELHISRVQNDLSMPEVRSSIMDPGRSAGTVHHFAWSRWLLRLIKWFLCSGMIYLEKTPRVYTERLMEPVSKAKLFGILQRDLGSWLKSKVFQGQLDFGWVLLEACRALAGRPLFNLSTARVEDWWPIIAGWPTK